MIFVVLMITKSLMTEPLLCSVGCALDGATEASAGGAVSTGT